MKKIIALWGRADIGKTTTLNYLIRLLDKSKEEEERPLNKDRRVVISYGNKKIAVTTLGDNIEEIDINIDFFEKNDCDILVTATRTRGKTVDTINKYCKENKAEVIWIKKEISETSAHLINQKQAKDIQTMIDKL